MTGGGLGAAGGAALLKDRFRVGGGGLFIGGAPLPGPGGPPLPRAGPIPPREATPPPMGGLVKITENVAALSMFNMVLLLCASGITAEVLPGTCSSSSSSSLL